MTRTLALLVASFALLALAPAAAAQAGELDFGLRAGVYTDISEAFVGAEMLIPVGAGGHWFFNPNFEIVLVDRGDLATVNADFHYDVDAASDVSVWLGGGPAIILRDGPGPNSKDDTDVGLNLLAGVGFLDHATIRPYIQGKLLLADESEAVLAFGIRFP